MGRAGSGWGYWGLCVPVWTPHHGTPAAAFIGAFLIAKEGNERVDLNSLRADRRWKFHDVYDNVPWEVRVGDLVDAKGACWHDFRALVDIMSANAPAHVTLASSAMGGTLARRARAGHLL